MLIKSIFSAALCLLAFNVNAAVIDFEEFQSSAPLTVPVIGDLVFTQTYYNQVNVIYVRDVSSLYGQINLASSGVMGAEVSHGLSISTVDGSSFDFISAYFGMTHPGDEYARNIFEGVRNGQVIYSTNIASGQVPTLNQFNWLSIDEIRVSSYFNTGYFIMDDIQYSVSAVPIPAAVWLFCSGLIGLAGFAKRKA